MKNHLWMTSFILISIMGAFSQPSLAATFRLSSSCLAQSFNLITLATESYGVFDSSVSFYNIWIARKKKYSCKVCGFPSHCNMKESQGCYWVSFYEGDTTVENYCCPGTKREVKN